MDTSIFQEMIDNWKSPIVARTEIEVFTGGLMTEKYQANLDSAGLGPKGRIRCGRKIGYSVKNTLPGLRHAVPPFLSAIQRNRGRP